ncbi:MAG: deoxyribonuclease V [Armatimonadota bacterium]
MLPRQQHQWNVSLTKAAEIQKRLRDSVSLQDDFPEIRAIAGVDVSVPSGADIVRSAVVILSFPDFELIEVKRAVRDLEFPYVPGFLSFREVPVILDSFEQIQNIPDITIIDGQGIAHPRGLGIAAHLGVLLDIASIGCAKSHLYGKFDEPSLERGSSSLLLDRSGKQIGTVLRTRTGTKPVFISPGHKVSFESSVKIILECSPRYRLPEPVRYAHKLAGETYLYH